MCYIIFNGGCPIGIIADKIGGENQTWEKIRNLKCIDNDVKTTWIRNFNELSNLGQERLKLNPKINKKIKFLEKEI